MAYKYRSLSSEDSLRLLEINALDGDDLLCSMRTVPIGGNTEYTALSYSWALDEDGDARLCERIFVDGALLNVTRNLYQGLRRICARQRPVVGGLIWIDAVCINQNDVVERNAQVARMAEIYSNAVRVLVWLGEGCSPLENDSIATALHCLSQRRHSHYREHMVALPNGSSVATCLAHAAVKAGLALESSMPPPGQGWEFEDPVEVRMPSCIRELFDVGELKESVVQTQQLLHTFLGKRYWSRRWVIQEIYHAQSDVQLMWADHEITFDLLSAILESALRVDWSTIAEAFGHDVEDEDGGDDWSYNTVAGPISLVDLYQNRASPQPDLLTWELSVCQEFNCFDPRDRLYALLSLDPESRLRPDYSLTPDQVYVSFFFDQLQRQDCLHSLLESAARNKTSTGEAEEEFAPPDLWEAEPVPQDNIAASLPSWCFDLRDTFLRPERSVSLGAWQVDDGRHLSCHAAVIGTLLSNEHGKFGGLSSFPDLPSKSEALGLDVKPGTRLRIVWQAMGSVEYGKPGDLACFFKGLDEELCSSVNLHAIILRPSSDDRLFKVVSRILVRPDLHVWDTEQDRFVWYGALSYLPQVKEREGYAYYRKHLCIC